jgi:16S rRNA (cytosine1407-C5)-methyltransferase
MKRKNRTNRTVQPPARQAALERFRPLLDAGEFTRMLEELDRPLYPSLRLNLLKTSPTAITDLSSRYGWQVEGVPYCPTGWWVRQADVPISQTIEHRLGRYYIQDAASMLPAELFDVNSLEAPLVLDMAASPGGKTTHLVDRNGDRGMIIANDSSKSRITALRLVLQTWGAVGTAITCFPGERFGDWFPETFDRVLLDAPCSMQGLRANENHPMRPITDRERDSLATRQTRLLGSAFRALKVGGEVVYSTCTLTPEENEGVLEQLLWRFPGAVEVVDLTRRLPRPAPALYTDGTRNFLPQIQGAARLWPHVFGTAGFFAALLIKTGAVESSPVPPPTRPWSMTGLARLSHPEKDLFCKSLMDGYGFDLAGILERNDWMLFRRAASILALPCRLAANFSGLPFVTAGLSVGEETPSGFALSHEWASRFEKDCPAGRFSIPADRIPAWLRGEDLHGFSAPTGLPGRIILVEDEQGNYLGRGRALSDRLKNLLPTRVVV